MIKYLIAILALSAATSTPCLSNTLDKMLNKVQDDPNRNIQDSMFVKVDPLNPSCKSWHQVNWMDSIYNTWVVCDISFLPNGEPTVMFVGTYEMGQHKEGLVYADQKSCTLRRGDAVIAKCAPDVTWEGRFPYRSYVLSLPNK